MNIALERHDREHPLVIAGPCAAEPNKLPMLIEMAQALLALEVPAMRASLRKPRTESGDFEGIGYSRGGEWFAKIEAECGIAMASEVFEGRNVDTLIRHLEKVPGKTQLIVWMGARNQLQTIQESVGRALRDAPDNTLLILKNQMWKDERHWAGIVSHVQKGAQFSESELRRRVALCHRGFNPGENGLRSVPDLHMAMRVREKTGLKMILDPSHIGGTRDNVRKIVDQVVADPNLNFDGFLIEVHQNPNGALTDAKQQLTLGELRVLLERIRSTRHANV